VFRGGSGRRDCGNSSDQTQAGEEVANDKTEKFKKY
jgi:hypothetical protein